MTGPILQATGVAEDARKTEPYLIYDQVDVRRPGRRRTATPSTASGAATSAIVESLKIIEQSHRQDPRRAGHAGKMPKNVKPPEGEDYVRTENPLGELGYYLVSRRREGPWRLKMRTPSFSNVSMIPYLLRGALLPDMIAVLGSVFFVVGDVDR